MYLQQTQNRVRLDCFRLPEIDGYRSDNTYSPPKEPHYFQKLDIGEANVLPSPSFGIGLLAILEGPTNRLVGKLYFLEIQPPTDWHLNQKTVNSPGFGN